MAVISILVQPTVGSISDYTVSRWGRRKPYIVIGSLLDVVFLVGIATSNTILMLGAFAALLSFSTNIARGPFQGYVPDLVPEQQVGLASAMVGLMQILGNVTGFVLVTVAVLLGQIEARDLRGRARRAASRWRPSSCASATGQPPKPRNGKSWATIAREVWGTDVLKERSYVWLLASRFFFLMGGRRPRQPDPYVPQTDAQPRRGRRELDEPGDARRRSSSPTSSRSSRRHGSPTGSGVSPSSTRAASIGFVGIVLAALAPAVPLAIVGGALFGASAGTFLAVDWALMTDIIPKASSGRYMGLSNVATTSSTVIAVATGRSPARHREHQLRARGWGRARRICSGARTT